MQRVHNNMKEANILRFVSRTDLPTLAHLKPVYLQNKPKTAGCQDAILLSFLTGPFENSVLILLHFHFCTIAKSYLKFNPAECPSISSSAHTSYLLYFTSPMS